jgi:hypothetical protein
MPSMQHGRSISFRIEAEKKEENNKRDLSDCERPIAQQTA